MSREYRGERGGYKYSYLGQERFRGPKKEYRFLTRIWKDGDKAAHEHESGPEFSSLREAVQAAERYTFAWIDAN